MIYVFERDLSDRKSVSSAQSIDWTEKYNEIGFFSIIVGATDRNAEILKNGKIIYYEGFVGIIQQVICETTTITINGKSLSELLNQRIILNEVTISTVESSLYSAWTENMRGIDVESSAAKGLTETYNTVLWGLQFGEAVQTMCKEADLGFRVVLDLENNKKLFEVYKGEEKSEIDNPKGVVFSTSKNTLSGIQIDNDDSSLKNVAYVFAADENEKRIVEVVGDVTGANRRELIVDQSGMMPEAEHDIIDENGNKIGTQPAETMEEFRQRLRTMGLDALRDYTSRLNFTATVPTSEYGTKYNLGDRVRCYSKKYNLQLTVRITEMRRVVDTTGSQLQLTLGEPKISMKEMVRIWQT